MLKLRPRQEELGLWLCKWQALTGRGGFQERANITFKCMCGGWGGGGAVDLTLRSPGPGNLLYTLLKQPGLRDFPDCPRARLLKAPYSFLQILSLSLSSFAVCCPEASLVSVTPCCVEISCADLGTIAVSSPNLPTWMSPEQASPRGPQPGTPALLSFMSNFFFFKLLVEIVTLSAKRNR